jgi:hypothetical protein
MESEHYAFPAAIELEYPIPKKSSALDEVAKCYRFCQNVINGA